LLSSGPASVSDGDVEVVFDVVGGKEGLARLTVVAPDGRTVVDFTAPDASTLGIRSFQFESPEPPDIGGFKAAYPVKGQEYWKPTDSRRSATC
jgi:hypothetical protein